MLSPDLHRPAVLREVSDVRDHLAASCFTTGPPTRIGVELEWTAHDAADPARPVDPRRLRAALGPYAPATLDPAAPHLPLRQLSTVTVEPGGQVELSTVPHTDLAALWHGADADIEQLTTLLSDAGLALGTTGIDPYRPPRQVLDTPRYQAMCTAFDRAGPAGRVMMCSTAGLQVCLDAGETDQLSVRWRAAHTLGPTLVALFATARRFAGRDTGWASARMAAWQHIDPARTRPVWSPAAPAADPVEAWTTYALAAPLICLRRTGPDWSAPAGVTFADWLSGALFRPPTTEDLDYHLSTLFPPVRPRGYLEIRYLDSQPAGEWIAPVALLAATLTDPSARDLALEACDPVADRWRTAAREALADPALAGAAVRLSDVALDALERLGAPGTLREAVGAIVRRRLSVTEGSAR